MLKKISLRMRLTLLSAMVMAGAAVILTSVFLFGADRIFVRNLPQEFIAGDEITFSSEAAEGMELASITFTVKEAGNRFNLWGTAVLISVLILGTAAAWLVAGRALQPLEELSGTIEEISGNDLSHRVELRDRQDEIGRLARSFNLMMDKVSASFERQKRFSASAAHELKTPLATIAVNLDVLALDEAPSPARLEKVLKVIRANNERMIRLVDDLFRLTSDKDSIMDEEISLEEILTETAEELSRPIQEKHLTVSIGSMPDIRLTGSRVMLSRAVGNLFENAVKYNRDYGAISITARREAGKIMIRMADTGIGIPKEEIPRIFEPFYRVDKSRSRAMGGSGLGLPLVKDIMEKHGGSITVKSIFGESTVFLLEFPDTDADKKTSGQTVPEQ
ncbi:sensor histidine kinase [Eisenbergiella sp.]